ncbi:hypothetical protein BC351_00985 [Paenibacillus ferrarius]|uniref:Uncharacterized protein n=1 Tax=Paenibacillus ferrarius TaxID=1469647 RepID=A0A1V4HSI9_9BACL|nr:hypothetical protein [Paenibacillus ferrarius]OPH61847.1 hypothetical protein BC351_00985 [Paenibacillus ferrarius]
MSCNETKTVLRAEIEELRSNKYNEAYMFFRGLGFREPDDIDGNDESVEWFYYKEKVGEVVPVYDYDEKRWGVDLVLGHSTDYDDSHSISTTLQELQIKINELSERFGNRNWKFVSYTWYNGSDEPIQF